MYKDILSSFIPNYRGKKTLFNPIMSISDKPETTSVESTEQELCTEKRCSEVWKEAMRMAMEGHARMLEQYADLEEKHINLLERHRKIKDGIDDVKRAAKARVRGADQSKFIDALAAEISVLRAEREEEIRYLRDENKRLQARLRDATEAHLQAAKGELLLFVKLKEAKEAIAVAEKRARDAEREAMNAFKTNSTSGS